MKILQLTITNLKRIKAIEIDPKSGEPVVLTGDNAQGKSSVLDSILFGLTNSGLDDPIRHGSPTGEVVIKLGTDKEEFRVERKATKKGSYLRVFNDEGREISKAQTFLNGLLGNYAFDPLEFVRLKPKQQVEALKEAAGLDFTDLDAKRADAYAERTTVGRDGKEAAAQLAAIPEPDKDTPKEEVSAGELVTKLQALEEKCRAAAKAGENAQAADQRRRDAASRVEQIERELAEARAELKASEDASVKAREDYAAADAAAPQPVELTAARESIDAVDATNRAVRDAAKWKEMSERVKSLRAKYAALDRAIEEVDEMKARMLSECNLPLDGLEFTDEGVMYRGTFFSQLSTAEQIRISTLVAMAQNPTLRIVMIREGALINRENMAMIAELAKSENYQLWVEKFAEEPGDAGLHIVDGAVAFVDGKEVEA
jgi:DNA repair exonuclease SbcCD ATPase subunit